MKSSGRLEHLDGLRGIGALMVYLNHFNGAYGLEEHLPKMVVDSPLVLLFNGGVGVAIFFVLSGFVLSGKYLRKGAYNISQELVPFLVSRIMRIYPPFLVVFLASALCMNFCSLPAQTLPAARDWINQYWAAPMSLKQVLREAVLFFPVPSKHLLPQDWTLTIELNVSIFMPIYTLLASFGWVPLLFFMLLKSIKELYLLHFLGGISLVKLQDRIEMWRWPKSMGASAIGLVCTVVLFWIGTLIPVLLAGKVSEDMAGRLMLVTHGLASFLLVGQALAVPWLANILSKSAIVYLGKISYGLYLIHFLVIKTVTPWIIASLNSFGLQEAASVKVASLVLTTVAVIFLCELFFRWVEKPCIHLGRKIGPALQRILRIS
jgi:peptidoglycan/LPS O-acetylase OafA/YrhL